MKKILIAISLIIIIAAGVGLYGAFQYRSSLRRARLNVKPQQVSVTFIEGWNSADIANYLDRQDVVAARDFLKATRNFNSTKYSATLPKEATTNLEGFLFPDTYFLPKTAPSSTTISNIIIGKALDNFFQKVTPEMLTQAQKDNMSLFQIVTLASIIEKETGKNVVTSEQKQQLDDERKIIAGIFYNRLQSGVPLQSDATVNFATGKSDPSASLQDTQTDSPYNTYKFRGLPPGPICNPSLTSIMAALYPTQTDYFYFLSNPITGQAVYARTYEEHLKNKQKYLR